MMEQLKKSTYVNKLVNYYGKLLINNKKNILN